MQLTEIIIGRKVYRIPEMNFAALEVAWPFVEEAIMSQGALEGPRACIGLIVATLIEEEDFSIEDDLWADLREKYNKRHELPLTDKSEWKTKFNAMDTYLKRQLLAKEIAQCKEALDTMLIDAGLLQKTEAGTESGEAKAGNDLTATSIPISPNSAPQELKEEAGKV